MTTPSLPCDFLGWRLHSPLVLASGIIGTSAGLMARAARAGAGMVTAKSCGPASRAGHPNPVALDWGGGLLNAIGLTNPGAEHEAALLAEARRRLAPLGVPLIASIFAGTVEEFGQVAAIVAQAQPDLIEVNISCPNVGDEFGTPFAGTPESAAAVTESVKRALARWLRTDRPERAALPLPLGEGRGEGCIPISVKLAPNVPDIARIARTVVEAGADAITAVNTMPGMVIDAFSGWPVLSNQVGGVSGPALKPIALRAVYEIAQAVDVPIIGTGGVSTGTDAAEMLMAGATVVGVGSAVWYRGVDAFGQINAELAAFMAQHGYPSVASLRRVSIQGSDRIRPIDRVGERPPSR
jgi:dihydroorotate dehydrogenase (NAD+) catalytic subunit